MEWITNLDAIYSGDTVVLRIKTKGSLGLEKPTYKLGKIVKIGGELFQFLNFWNDEIETYDTSGIIGYWFIVLERNVFNGEDLA